MAFQELTPPGGVRVEADSRPAPKAKAPSEKLPDGSIGVRIAPDKDVPPYHDATEAEHKRTSAE